MGYYLALVIVPDDRHRSIKARVSNSIILIISHKDRPTKNLLCLKGKGKRKRKKKEKQETPNSPIHNFYLKR